MEIQLKSFASGYELEHLTRVFYPGAVLRKTGGTRGVLVYARMGTRHMAVGVRTGTAVYLQKADATQPQAQRILVRMLYNLLRTATGQRPPWGMLTGVRPVSFLRHSLQKGGPQGAQRELVEYFDVSGEKYNLACLVEQQQRPVLAAAQDNDYSLYVSIPFCPSRCSYCSFVSKTIGSEGQLAQPYLQALKQELACTAQVAQNAGLQLASIYVGGGTPTSLNAEGLEFLLQSIAQYFDTSAVAEYTVEAGRPDCTDYQKLELLHTYGVSRISINPQTMQDEVLLGIGRRHTAQDVVRCYEDARRAGHKSINMDLIAGLPGDTAAGFADTLTQVLALNPENITVHTLTKKRASDLAKEELLQNDVALMLQQGYPRLQAAGYLPYYMYRQKGTLQNMENTGWTRPGYAGLYNIHIMEEMQTILATGAGASTKLVAPQGRRMQRIFNYKYPAEYIRMFDEVLARKKEVEKFYVGNLDTQTTGRSKPD
ncbi:MAG: coproporphyrinogen dehydrogenase HemZ [Oscillospiraceae bacterium]